MIHIRHDLWPTCSGVAAWFSWLITPGLPAIGGILIFSSYASYVFTRLWYAEWRTRTNQYLHDVYAAMAIFTAANALGAIMTFCNPLWLEHGNVALIFIGNLSFAIFFFARERRRAATGTHQFNTAPPAVFVCAK